MATYKIKEKEVSNVFIQTWVLRLLYISKAKSKKGRIKLVLLATVVCTKN